MGTLRRPSPVRWALIARPWLHLAALVIAVSLSEAPQAIAQTSAEELLKEIHAEMAAADHQLTYAGEREAERNIPNATVKAKEDALDRAARANDDTPAEGAEARRGDETSPLDSPKAAAQAAEDAARRDADAARGTTNEEGAQRADRYREALRARREARKKLKRLRARLAEVYARMKYKYADMSLEVWDRQIRVSEEPIPRRKPLLDDEKMGLLIAPPSGLPVTCGLPGQLACAYAPPASPIGITGPIRANVAIDSQVYCTFGKAAPALALFTPTGPLMSNISDAPADVIPRAGPAKADKPPAGATPAKTPPAGPPEQVAGLPPAEAPATGGAQPGNPPKAPTPPDATPAPTGDAGGPADTSNPGDIEIGRNWPFPDWLNEQPQVDPPGAPPKLDQPDVLEEGILDEIGPEREKEMQIESAFQSPQEARTPPAKPAGGGASAPSGDKPGDKPIYIGPLPPGGLRDAGVTSKGGGEYAPSPGASLEPIPTPAPTGDKSEAPSAPPAGATSGAPAAGSPPAEKPGATPAPTEGKPTTITSLPGAPPIQAIGAPPGVQVATGVVGSGPALAIDPAPDAARSTNTVTLDFKATEAVMTGRPDLTKEVKQQLVKIVPIEEPAHPKTGTTKTAKAEQDKGYDKSPVQCTTDAKGECRAEIPPEEREVYGFPKTGSSSYRADFNLPQNSGGVIMKPAGSPKTKLPDAAPAGAKVTASEFKIGNATVTRLSYAAPSELIPTLDAKYSKSFGKSYQTDKCGEKKPGPPLGMEPVSYSALNRELPQATIQLGGLAQEGTP